MELLDCINTALNNRPAHSIEPGERAHAAVALILSESADGLHILLIQRSINENDFWSGQLGLPGGRVEPADLSTRHTAERETREEIGLDLAAARYLGRISDIAAGGLHLVVSCFVYAVEQAAPLHLDQEEIAVAFWVPARELDKPDRRSQVNFTFRDRQKRFPALRVADKEQPLWGLTYRLLRNFTKVIGRQDCTGFKQFSPEKPLHDNS